MGKVETEQPMVEYIPRSLTKPFAVRLGGIEELLTEQQFKALYSDMEDAARAYEAERIANREYLKMKYERAKKRRRK